MLKVILVTLVASACGGGGNDTASDASKPVDTGPTLDACTPSAGLRCPAGSAWEARHGLSPAMYQQTFDALVAQGYRLSHVVGYPVAGQETYAAIWEKCTSPPWEAHSGLTSAAFQQKFDTLVAQGYRLVEVSSYGIGATELHAGIFEKRSGPEWQAKHGLSAAEYQQMFDMLVAQGYRPIHAVGYSTGSQERYSAIWELCKSPAWEARHGLTAAEYQQTFDALVAQGYRAVQVSGDNVSGLDLYTAIFDKSAIGEWRAFHGLASAAAYQQMVDTLSSQGFRVTDVSGYAGEYAGIMTK